MFSQQWIFRLFIVLQVAGFIGLIVLMVTGGSGHWELSDLQRERYWDGRRGGGFDNWLAMYFTFVPFLITEAVDVVYGAKRN